MSRSLEAARAALKKNKKVDMDNRVILDPKNMPSFPHISTGSLVVDFAIGGAKLPNGQRQCPGIPKGRITEIYGNEGAGKTTLALETAVQVQRAGGTVCFIDFENAISPAYAQSLGVRFDEDVWDIYSPMTWEEGAEIIMAMTEAKVSLLIVDSVSAMVPAATLEKETSETGQIGLLARLQSEFLPKLVSPLREQGTALIYLNQLRQRIKTNKYDAGPDEDTSGGKALKYYSSLRLKLKKVKSEYANIQNDLTGESEKQAISNIVRVQCTKNKVSSHQGFQADFVLRYGEGIDNPRSIIDIAENRKVVRASGSWYSFTGNTGEEIRMQGKESLRKYLMENESQLTYLSNLILSSVQDPLKRDADTALVADNATAPESTVQVVEEVAHDPEMISLLEDAIANGKVVQAGPWFKFTDESGEAVSLRGQNTVVEYLMDNPAYAEHLMTLITAEG